MKSKINSIRK